MKKCTTSMGGACALVFLGVTCASGQVAASALDQRSPATLPSGMPLRIQIDHGYPLKSGTEIEGHLIAPVYHVDHLVLPVNTKVTGTITGKHPISRSQRANALLNGDFTPLAVPDVTFDRIQLPDGHFLSLSTHVTERTVGVVHMATSGKRPSMVGQAKEQIKQRKQETLDTFEAPGKRDRLMRYVYAQLPYHPQRIWTGTQYDADLTAPLSIPEKDPPPASPIAQLNGKMPTGHIEARLTHDLNSAKSKQGSEVEAVLAKPLFDADQQHLLLPEGTRLTGSVLQVKPAAWFSRNGRLRFTFRKIDLPQGTEPVQVHGQMTAAEADKSENLSIDQEGGAKAKADKGKVLAPLALGILAASSMDKDGEHAVVKNGVVSNGFGIIARVITMATANINVASGFAYFALAKSVYRRWIAKGHEVEFPKDTRIEIDLSER